MDSREDAGRDARPPVDDAAGGRLPADRTSRGPLPARVGAPVPKASLTLVVGFIVLLGCLLGFGALAEAIRTNEQIALDATASPLLHAMASPGLDAVMNVATFLGSTFVITPCFLAAILLLVRGRRAGSALFLVLVTVGSLLLNELMKLAFHRPRPQLPWSHIQPDFSFPSGHTMHSMAFYVALAVIAWSLWGRRRGAVALAMSLALTTLIGISRIYLGYHYLTDVLGGALAGLGWVLVVLAAFRTRFLAPYWPVREPGTAAGVQRHGPLRHESALLEGDPGVPDGRGNGSDSQGPG